MRMGLWALAVLLGGTLLLGSAGHAADEAARRQQRARLELELARVRVQLLQTRPELRELNERIVSLQQILLKKLDEQPEMTQLRQQLQALDEAPAAEVKP